MSQGSNLDERASNLRFIKDVPAELDEFGTHERIARAVAGVIKSHDELKVIGLIGPWGSGKSTVISLVQRLLSADKKSSRVFLYDAWKHQSDPPRRAFLEQLLKFLGLSEVAEWKALLEELNGQIDDASTTTTPSLTSSGKWILFSLLLLPFGFEFTGHDWLDVPLLEVGNIKLSVFCLGMVLLAQPALVAIGVYYHWRESRLPFSLREGYSRIWKWAGWFAVILGCLGAVTVSFALPFIFQGPADFRLQAGAAAVIACGILAFLFSMRVNASYWKKKNWKVNRHPYERDSVLTLFMSRAVTRVDHITTKSPDPTTIEFQQAFRRIMDAVFNPNERLIFVVDNLDRLQESQAVELWATIRSFFLGSNEQGASASNRKLPTILLPIDPAAVKRMYAAHGDQAPELAQAFLDKTLDLAFSVPPPVFSDWRNYLSKQLTLVFASECHTEWQYAVCDLYETYLRSARNPPVTPRTLNTLVNSIAVLWLQWKEEAPFPTIAYYAINKEGISKGFQEFVTGSVRPEIQRFDEEWTVGLAAIHFGVPRASALQVYMTEPLRDAIDNCNEGLFRQFSQTPGFDRVLEAIVVSAGDSMEFIANTSALVSHLPPEATWVKSVWKRLLLKIATAEPWTKLKPEGISGIGQLITHVQSNDLERNLSKLMARVPLVGGDVFHDPVGINSWAELIETFLRALDGRGITPGEVEFGGGSAEYLHLITVISDKPTLLKRIAPKSSDADIINTLTTQLSIGQGPNLLEAKFDLLGEIRPVLDWKPVSYGATEAIKSARGDSIHALAALRILGKLRTKQDSDANQSLENIYNEGFLFQKFEEAFASDNVDGMVASLALLILTRPSFPDPSSGSWQDGKSKAMGLKDNVTLIDKLTAPLSDTLNLFSDGSIQTFLVEAAVSNKPMRPLLRNIITRRVLAEGQGALNLKDIFDRLPTYLEYVDEFAHPSFASDLSVYDGFWEELKEAPFNDNTRKVFRLLLKSAHAEIVERSKKELLERLHQLPQSDWDAAIRAGAEPYGIASELHKILITSDFGDRLYDALKALAAEISTASEVDLLRRWFEMVGFVSASERIMLLKMLRDQYLYREATVASLPSLTAGGNTLLEDGHFSDDADKSVRYILLPFIHVPESQDWIVANGAALRGWVAQAPAETKEVLRERMAAIWDEKDESRMELARKFGDVLGLSNMPWHEK